NRGEAQSGGVVEVRDRLVEVEGDRVAVAGQGLVVKGVLCRGGLVGPGVLRGARLGVRRDVQVRDLVGRALVDHAGRERPRDAVLHVIAGHRRAVLPRDSVAQREAPLGRGRVLRPRVGGHVRNDRGPFLGIGRVLIGGEGTLDGASEEGQVLTGIDALRVYLVPLLSLGQQVDRAARLRACRRGARRLAGARCIPATTRRQRDR